MPWNADGGKLTDAGALWSEEYPPKKIKLHPNQNASLALPLRD